MESETEKWQKIEGWPYEVSSLGRVRRCEPASGTRVGLVLKLYPDRYGYLRAFIRRRGEKQVKVPAHHLVLEAFVGPCPEGHVANHKNGDKADNRVENLEWVTRSENQDHAYATGLQGRGEEHGRSKLTEEDVVSIRKRYKAGGVSQTALAEEYGVHQTLIGFVVRREVWTHI